MQCPPCPYGWHNCVAWYGLNLLTSAVITRVLCCDSDWSTWTDQHRCPVSSKSVSPSKYDHYTYTLFIHLVLWVMLYAIWLIERRIHDTNEAQQPCRTNRLEMQTKAPIFVGCTWNCFICTLASTSPMRTETQQTTTKTNGSTHGHARTPRLLWSVRTMGPKSKVRFFKWQ